MPAAASLDETARGALAAAALLLCAPDERVHAQLQAAGLCRAQPLAVLRQSFYDRFCIPQSGLYLPPFENVFRQRKQVDGLWHFPHARFDSAGTVEAIYSRFGFDRTQLAADPILRAPHLPADHLGFMLAFAGWVLQGATRELTLASALLPPFVAFAAAHLDTWVDAYCDLVQGTEPCGYPAAVGQAVREAVVALRQVPAEPGTTVAIPAI